MLDLYFYTNVIGQKSCNMWSILNKLTLHKELHQCLTNNVFGQKNKNTTTKQKIKHKKDRRSWGLNPGCLAPKADALPLHHRVNWEERLQSTYLTVSTQLVNKAETTGHTFSTNSFFCNMFTCMDNYIWQCLIFSGLCFTP